MHAAGLLVVTAVVAYVTGSPFLFPSLGPSAYALATGDDAPDPLAVVGNHVIGVGAGLLAYHALAGGVTLTSHAPLSTGGVRLAASAVASVGLTTVGGRATGFDHPPACATTLIVSLGLLASPTDAAIIVGSVVSLVAVWWLGRALTSPRGRAPGE